MLIYQKYKNNIPWIEKYRPKNLKSIISQSKVKDSLFNLIKNNNLPHLLFYGSSGTGKTSTILACAEEFKNNGYCVSKLELNASNQRGIEIVRKTIKEYANTKSLAQNGLKIIILDEADYMTKIAQCALRRIIEKYSNNVRFCIICNYINKIIPAIKSRCMIFKFSKIEEIYIFKKLKNICQKENINLINDKCLKFISNISNGDLRKSINTLHNLNYLYDNLNIEQIKNFFGYIPQKNEKYILNILNNKTNIKNIYNFIDNLLEKENIFIENFIEFIFKYIKNNIKKYSKKKIIKFFINLSKIEYLIKINCNLFIIISFLSDTIYQNLY